MIQKDNYNERFQKKLKLIKSKLGDVKNFDELGKLLNIDIKIFQYKENI